MSSTVIPVDPFDLVIFGGTGDLAMRKLLPALFRRDADGQIPAAARILGLARTDQDTEAFKLEAREALQQHVAAEELSAEAVERFIKRLSYLHIDVTDSSAWGDLVSYLNERPEHIRVYYLAVGPALFGTIAQGLANVGLATVKARLVVEKPLGHDLESAIELNQAISSVFNEKSVYRIDHYLGKETVQNLMALRFANALFEPLWNANRIDHVQITAEEKEKILRGLRKHVNTKNLEKEFKPVFESNDVSNTIVLDHNSAFVIGTKYEKEQTYLNKVFDITMGKDYNPDPLVEFSFIDYVEKKFKAGFKNLFYDRTFHYILLKSSMLVSLEKDIYQILKESHKAGKDDERLFTYGELLELADYITDRDYYYDEDNSHIVPLFLSEKHIQTNKICDKIYNILKKYEYKSWKN